MDICHQELGVGAKASQETQCGALIRYVTTASPQLEQVTGEKDNWSSRGEPCSKRKVVLLKPTRVAH